MHAADSVNDAVQMAGSAQCGRQGAQQIIKRGYQRQSDDPVIYRPVMLKELAKQRKQDKGDRKGVQEHQHRYRVFDDGGKAEIGNDEGNQRDIEQLVINPTAVFRQARVTVTARIKRPIRPRKVWEICANATPPFSAAGSTPRLLALIAVTAI